MTLIESRLEQSKIEKYRMNKVNRNIVNKDLITIKKELYINPRLYIQDLLKSLTVKRRPPFPAYKVDLSLAYLKSLYEHNFPQIKHGGHLAHNNNEIDSNMSRGKTYNVKECFTLKKGILLPHRSIIKNLFEVTHIQNHIPSFVEIISKRVSLSKTAIQNRIRVGKYMINSERIDDLILLYRKKGASHSKVLKEIRKIDKMIICEEKLIKIKLDS